MEYYVYVLECSDGSLYTGCTNDIVRRVHEHNHAKKGAHYTKIRRPVVLKYSEQFPDLASARSREAGLKRLSREQKILLITNTVLK